MRKFLNKLFYMKIKAIGFDLDGTLYKEVNFIEQVYREIVHQLNLPAKESLLIFSFMLRRWLEKGSSYPCIFKETQDTFLEANFDFVNYALSIYRSFLPKLTLEPVIRKILQKMKDDGKSLFLVTDGNEKLQQNKIDALSIRDLFSLIIITGSSPKPDSSHGEKILEALGCEPREVLFIGDRDIDRSFAVNCGFYFISVQDLWRVCHF